MTKVNENDIIYDSYGNIINYGNVSIHYNSRNLMESYNDGSNSYSFAYNYQGIRTKKKKNGNYEVNYYLDGTKIIGEDVINENNEIIRKFRYFYDANGVCGINYIIDDVDHYFNLIQDSLGNISKVMYRGKIIGEYTYDAWGNCSVKIFNDTNPNEIDRYIVNNNPFRFKGYYCDLETNLYYCQFRYYNPEFYQWLSPDSVGYLDSESINGLNLYAYCENDPLNKYDPSGHFALSNWAKWVIGGVVILGLGIATVATGGAAAGVAGFIVAGAFKGAVIGAISGALISGTIGGITSAIAGNGFWNGFADGSANGFMSGAIIGGITGAISSGVQVANAAKSWVSAGGKTSFKQMTEHYTRHVINEGQKSVAKNIVNYTKQAKAFFANYNTSGYLLRDGVIKIAGAPGGIFNTSGLIRSFWYVLL